MRLRFKLSPASILWIAGIVAAVMVISSYLELNQSRNEIYHLLYEHSSSLIESVIQSSTNTLNSSLEIEDLITERLFDNARALRKLDSLNSLNRNFLIDYGKQNNLYRINVFDASGNRVMTNRIPEPGHEHGEEKINRYDELAPVLAGETDEFIIGIKKAEYADEERYAVAVSRARNNGAIVVNMDAAGFLDFRKKIGIGSFLQTLADHPGLEYIILQDSLGVLAASGRIDTTESLLSSEFLISSLNKDTVLARNIGHKGKEVYEVVKRFMLDGEPVGIFRLGVSLDEIKNVENRMFMRIAVISLILAAIAIIVLSIIFTTQNLKTVSAEYNKFKTLTSSVLENMTEAVIVFDYKREIILFNKSAEELFNTSAAVVVGKPLFSVISGQLEFLNRKGITVISNQETIEKNISMGDEEKFLSFNLSRIEDPGFEQSFYLLVITDLTEKKRIEEQAKRNEKLSAMGELASGVAHEIRNPINSIGMISQRLNKEFTPSSNQEEYSSITSLLRTEVNRINKIITQFLNYAKPIGINKHPTDVENLFNEIYQLFIDQAKLRGINFSISGKYALISIDKDLVKQALMNIIQNAFDASGENGKVAVEYSSVKDSFYINICDNGKGIPAEAQKKIFDLYYTTKKDGNGLGLSISQKIISEHSGSIFVSSEPGHGSVFKITLPVQ